MKSNRNIIKNKTTCLERFCLQVLTQDVSMYLQTVITSLDSTCPSIVSTRIDDQRVGSVGRGNRPAAWDTTPMQAVTAHRHLGCFAEAAPRQGPAQGHTSYQSRAR